MRFVCLWFYLLFLLFGIMSCSVPAADPEATSASESESTSGENEDDDDSDDDSGEDSEDDNDTESDDNAGGDSPVASGGTTLALDTNPQRSFPAGLAVSPLSENPDAETVAPVVAGSIAISSLLAGESGMDHCPNTDLDKPMTPFTGGGGPPGQIKNDNDFLMCRQSLSYGQKFKEQVDLLTGKAEKCFRRRWIQGITMQLANGCFTFGMSNDSGFIQPDNRICSVAYTQDEAGKVAGLLETGLLISAAAICQSIKDEAPIVLPEVADGSVDVKTHLQKAFTEASEDAKIDLAKITKLADEDGRPTYKTQIDLSGLAGSVRKLDEYSLTVIHTPPEEESADFHGRMWIAFKNEGNQDSTRILNIAYHHKGKKAETLRTVYETRYIERIDLVSAASANDIFDEDGRLEFEKIFQNKGSSNYNSSIASFANGIRYVAIDMNPWTGAGKMAVYQNPGVNYTEDAVGMSFEMTLGTDNNLSGCSASGSMRNPATSIRKVLADGGEFIPTGRRCSMNVQDGGICNPQSPDDKVYYQCFRQTSSGDFSIDSSKITNTSTGYDEPTASTVSINAVSVDDIPKYEQNVME